MIKTDTLIIGASAAGLASAAWLKKKNISFIILEKSSQVGTSWRNHYDRLHLHTSKKWSALPFINFSESIPKYPSRLDVVNYLENYGRALEIKPEFGTEVLSAKSKDNNWIVETSHRTYQSRFLIVATGTNHSPKIPQFIGLESFEGIKIHSSQYKNGKPFAGKRVLVVGFGNSACEQAICLYEHGAFPSLSVRSAVNVLPRDIFGFPVLEVGKFTSIFSPRVADKINGPIIRLLVGDITKLGLRKSKYGPREQIAKLRRIPLLDIGTMQLIREGHVKVYGDIQRIEGNRIYFEDNRQQDFDAIILATGYEHGLESFIETSTERMNDIGNPINQQTYFGQDGLYFCGFYVSPQGMLHEIGIEAKKIAEDVEKWSA